jgi:hypothetical protein
MGAKQIDIRMLVEMPVKQFRHLGVLRREVHQICVQASASPVAVDEWMNPHTFGMDTSTQKTSYFREQGIQFVIRNRSLSVARYKCHWLR